MKNSDYYKKMCLSSKKSLLDLMIEQGFLNLSYGDVNELMDWSGLDKMLSPESVVSCLNDEAKKRRYYIDTGELLRLSPGGVLTHCTLSEEEDGVDLYNSRSELAAMDGEEVFFLKRVIDGIVFKNAINSDPVEFQLTFREVRSGIGVIW